MSILIGVDEAGYGPVLGPLVVTAAAFETPDAVVEDCLWHRLRESITPRMSKRDGRLPLFDSKKLYHREEGLGTLERTALTLAAVGGFEWGCFADLIRAVAPDAAAAMGEYPWYRGFDARLPTVCDATAIRLRANAVMHDAARSGIRFLGYFTEILPEGHFNRLVATTGNKAVASMGLVLRTMHRVARAVPDGRVVRVCIDRQGGRTHYRDVLTSAFEPSRVDILEETDERSAYQLMDRSEGGGPERVEFLTRGESKQLPIALAGIWSKYVRELCMTAFNAWWTSRVAGLRPTAGYYQDAQRFLAEIEPAFREAAVPRDLLVRQR
ncbi:MAG: hypothetical protein HOP29_18970 [Phycisphaerales bacterium]|nr:hypothetical protein [Phycisphaerales bacterium]